MAEYDYDLVVIGSGPAGEKGAAQAAYFGKRVAIIEKQRLVGGACVNTGTRPVPIEGAMYTRWVSSPMDALNRRCGRRGDARLPAQCRRVSVEAILGSAMRATPSTIRFRGARDGGRSEHVVARGARALTWFATVHQFNASLVLSCRIAYQRASRPTALERAADELLDRRSGASGGTGAVDHVQDAALPAAE